MPWPPVSWTFRVGRTARRQDGATFTHTRGGSVRLIWVPSHVGIFPNAYADAVATAFLTAEPWEPEPPLLRTLCALRDEVTGCWMPADRKKNKLLGRESQRRCARRRRWRGSMATRTMAAWSGLCWIMSGPRVRRDVRRRRSGRRSWLGRAARAWERCWTTRTMAVGSSCQRQGRGRC